MGESPLACALLRCSCMHARRQLASTLAERPAAPLRSAALRCRARCALLLPAQALARSRRRKPGPLNCVASHGPGPGPALLLRSLTSNLMYRLPLRKGRVCTGMPSSGTTMKLRGLMTSPLGLAMRSSRPSRCLIVNEQPQSASRRLTAFSMTRSAGLGSRTNVSWSRCCRMSTTSPACAAGRRDSGQAGQWAGGQAG